MTTQAAWTCEFCKKQNLPHVPRDAVVRWKCHWCFQEVSGSVTHLLAFHGACKNCTPEGKKQRALDSMKLAVGELCKIYGEIHAMKDCHLMKDYQRAVSGIPTNAQVCARSCLIWPLLKKETVRARADRGSASKVAPNQALTRWRIKARRTPLVASTAFMKTRACSAS